MDRGGLICVGEIGAAFGVRGENRVKSFCERPESIAEYAPLQNFDGTRQFTLRITGRTKNDLTARLSGVDNRDQANALRGTRLYSPRSKFPELQDDEFYQCDLVGAEARNANGETVGKIIAVHNHGGGDLIEISVCDQTESLLLTFNRATVPNIDLDKGFVTVVLDEPQT